MKVLALLVAVSLMLFAANAAYALGGGGGGGDGRTLFLQNPGTGSDGNSSSGSQGGQIGNTGGSGGGITGLSCGSPPSTGVTVPEPATLLFVGLGILGLAGLRRRFSR